MNGKTKKEKGHRSSSVTTHQRTFFSGQGPDEIEHPVDAETTKELLTEAEIKSAIGFMRNSYARESIELLNERFGLTKNKEADKGLVLAIAQYQDSNGLKVDGKLGENTFNTIQAEGGSSVLKDIVIFRVMSPLLGRMNVTGGPGLTSFLGQFTIEIRLPPGEDCSKYEYRQFICARVEMLPAGANPAGPLTDLRSLFSVPGGLQTIPNYTEDGNTGLTPPRMGHRNQPGSTSPVNHYLNSNGSENQASGCIFKGEDFPGITGRITNTGEQYEFDFRFMGVVRHKDRGIIAKKFWSVRDDFVI